ncbi:MAG: hypothetical protein WCQ99_00505 [Pseudomonadota bacterium]
MSDVSFAPYFKKMVEQLNQVPLKKKSQRERAGITLEAFGTEKVEKIGIGALGGSSFQYGACTLFPAAGYDLPIFFSFWEEKKEQIAFMVDLIPSVDSLVDEPYRKKYVESMDPLWLRFEKLPGICPEEHNGLRGLSSIICTAARVPIDNEGMRLAALAPHTEYLKSYMEFIKAAAPVTDSAKLREIQRKVVAVKSVLQQYLTEALAGQPGQSFAEDKELIITTFI